ncbi:ribose-phosphate pyrophosphokinase [Rhodococcus sp. D2-41]|uniref:Phosphoribosyltransferase family protein n=1 Tax=Speluncibacter jeojiensis TaxID=2710754 RepID=A0A9X4RIG0_9ACTN|nr:phosphoribosyltransferase family protein [Rhodococcus sp. D2-41]MDG3009240.1 ribose-phosphate pyrophosphokinase [Rhodococcus sp. D2-41]MDG3016086.1 phosphoribosyltransferase family protein [Corynebacteriales bacterium D3-21]
MITTHARVPEGWGIRGTDEFARFPAGERHVRDLAPETESPCYVVVRGADANDYISAAMWIDLQHRKGHKVTAVVPYLPGARQDRGRPFGAAVYAGLINAMKADRVAAFDPHSAVMPQMIDNLVVVDSTRAVRRAVTNGAGDTTYTGVISPDAGALERAGKVAQALHVPLYRASKRRDFATGALSGFDCEALPPGGRYLVVDDICDGGGTFLGLAEATGLPAAQLGLWVSHGVFSGRADRLGLAFGEIITTDSHPGHCREDVAARIVPVLPHMISEILQ